MKETTFRNKLTILHTSDIHFNKKHFQWIASQQNNYDVFCITGDFLDELQEDELSQIKWVTSWIKSFKKPLFVCSGNHDISVLEHENWLNEINTSNYYCDGQTKLIDGVRFFCAPYENYDGFENCDILLNHLPPSKTKVALTKNGEDWGDKQLYRAITQNLISPKVVLSGHIHKPQSTKDELNKVKLYNPSLQTKEDIPFFNEIEI